MRKLIFTLIFLVWTSSFAQLNKLQGEWVTSAHELIYISDTTTNSVENYLKNSQLQHNNFNLFIYGDTLSFQAPFYFKKDFNNMTYHDRYDLKIINLTDTTLVLIPVSDFSRAFFKTDEQLIFKRLQYPNDSIFKFEKIIFHTSACHGICNVYHLEIENTRHFKLYAQTVWKITRDFHGVKDNSSQGYFVGRLKKDVYNNLIKALENRYFTKLDTDNILCCDASIITIIVYFNGQRTYYKTMFPQAMAKNLVNILQNICENNKRTKTNERFNIEQ